MFRNAVLKRPIELHSMLRHAEYQEQQEQLRWLRAHRQTQQAQQRLAELQAYTREYQACITQVGNAGELLNHRNFVDKLQRAVKHQGQVCQQARDQVAERRQSWHEQQKNLRALENMQKTRRQAFEMEQARLEQRALDDLSRKGAEV